VLALRTEGDVAVVHPLEQDRHDRLGAGRADDAEWAAATLEPAGQDHVRQVTDVIVVVVGDEHRADLFDRDAGASELEDDAAARVEEKARSADLEHRGRPVASRVGYRTPRAEERELHVPRPPLSRKFYRVGRGGTRASAATRSAVSGRPDGRRGRREAILDARQGPADPLGQREAAWRG
jgi:hypothetical protein